MDCNLTMNGLENCFRIAQSRNQLYVAIEILPPNCTVSEVIINPRENFASKLEYYKNAYNEDLTLKSFPTIKITGFTYGMSYEEIENDLYLYSKVENLVIVK